MMLHFLYETIPGRGLLKVLTWPYLSTLCGKFLDTGISRFLIPFFVRKNGIDLTICEKQEFTSFNDCFCRKIKEEERPVDMQRDAFVSPCDAYLSVYQIQKDLVIPVKQSRYRISDLLCDSDLATRYNGGYCYVFRLCVDHYHRYCFPANGWKEALRDKKIQGVLHTVRPIALRNIPVFTENSREYTELHTEGFGDVIQMEVGAMLVGKIANHAIDGAFTKGQEKGHFLYGGSTIILLTQDIVKPKEKFLVDTQKRIETPVKYGERINI